MNMDPSNVCGKCFFYVDSGDLTNGACHFAPPVAVALGSNVKTIRPQVTVTTRACGQYQEAPSGKS